MMILFTADLHGLETAYVDFARILRIGNFKCGVIAGDLMDDVLAADEMIELSGATEDDFLSELPGAEETFDYTMQREIKRLRDPEGFYMRALNAKERRLKEILFTAEKPIFIVRGNHDMTCWSSEANIHNIHWKKVNFQGYNFVGYYHTGFSRTQKQQREDLITLKKFVDRKTILVTHTPAFGVLDRMGHDPSWSLGSRALQDMLQERQPRIHIHGHIHEAAGYKLDHRLFSFNVAYPIMRQFAYVDIETLSMYGWISHHAFPTPESLRHESDYALVHGYPL